MFKSEKINEFMRNNKHSFMDNVFREFKNEQYQYIRELLTVSKKDEIKNLKQQVTAYEQVLRYLKAGNFDVNIKEYTHEEYYDEVKDLLEKTDASVKSHIGERIIRYQSIIDISEELIKIIGLKSSEQEIEQIIDNYNLDSINNIEDHSQKRNFYRILFSMLLRVVGDKKEKISYIKEFLGEGVLYDDSIKILYIKNTKPVIVKSVPSFLKALDGMDELFYRGHSSAAYKMVPSVYRDGLFFFEDRMIKEMMLELPEEFKAASTHYDKMLKMQHYGIPTKLLDITSNPLVALFMASDGDEHSEGEVLLIEQDSFDVCYPSSDRVKILTSVPFLPYATKIALAHFLEDDSINDKKFNQLAKTLLHEIKHEMPAFESRMEKEDLKKHLFVLGPKRNKRIYAQSGHFIISPLTLKSYPSIPVRFVGNEHRMRILVPSSAKKGILQELKNLNISRSTMYPEIEHVANEIKSTYL